MSGDYEILNLYRENRELRAENEELRRQLNNRSPPRIIRSRSRSPSRRNVRQRSQSPQRFKNKKIPSKTDIFIGNYFDTSVAIEKDDFFEYLRKGHGINCKDVRRLGDSAGGRLILYTNEDQTKFLDNQDEISSHFGLNNITIFTIKK